MTIDIKRARDFVYSTGTLWEKALFAYLFQQGSLEHLHQCLLCYKNPDGGWGHGIEHDLQAPDSNTTALEYTLSVLMRDTNIPLGKLLDGTPQWLEGQRNADGSLKNPDSIFEYPIAPWWAEWRGQPAPDSIVGNLTKAGCVTPSLAKSTRQWVQENLTLEKIKANEWLFMAYHGFDYFMNVDDFPQVEVYRQAVIDNIIALARQAPEKQYFTLFQFVTTPDSPIARALPDVITRNLDYLASVQRDDGGWSDEHDMKHWQPYFTTIVLLALHRFGRW